jgi:SAM-dependent methyltransferase
MKLADYFELWHVSRRRSRSESDYRHFQNFQASLLLEYLASHGVRLPGKRLLDLGSGVAGYSQTLAASGAEVISVDLVQPRIAPTNGLVQVEASALALPLASESTEVVFCASLIEHVSDPQRVLAEAERVLKPGGTAYFSFPPYYSPLGGHEYAPFHYLGQKLALRLVKHRSALPDWVSQMHQANAAPSSFADLYRGWGLYRMTVRRFLRLVSHTRFRLINLSTRYLPVSFIRWPLLGEVLTWHAQFLLTK